MKRTASITLLFLLFAGLMMVNPAYAANIIWVTGDINDADGNDADKGFVDVLVAAGHDVTVANKTFETRPLRQGQIDTLNMYDLVIISRSTNSGDYNTTSWNLVEKPLLLTTTYLSRDSRWKWLHNSTMLDDGGAPMFKVQDPAHPIFDGVTLDADNQVAALDSSIQSGNTSFQAIADPGNGQLLASVADSNGYVAIVYWPWFTKFYPDDTELAHGPRLLFPCGTRESSATPADTTHLQGTYNLTADGEKMFLNAVDWLISVEQPLLDITDLDGGYIKSSNEDSLWTGPASNGSPNGERIQFLIDNDVETKFLVGADTSWIDFYSTTLSMVTSYALTSANDVPTRDPKHWVFQGWDAETLSWVTLDSVVDNPVWEERFQKRTFEIENDKYFSNYRLHILSTNDDPEGLMQIAEWEIFGEFGDMVDGDVTNYTFVTRGSNEDSLWSGPGTTGGSPDAEKLPKLTDNDINTKYLVDAIDSWLDIHTTKMSKVTSYTITSANDSPERDPNSWTLAGWDRMTATWVTIDSVVGQPQWEERFQTKTFDVANDKWFSSYRLHITANNGETEPLMQIAELQLLGEIGEDVPADITDLKVEIVSENDDLPWTGPDSDGSPDNERIEKLIDNDANTKFLVGDDMCWIDIYTKKLSMVTGYSLTSANDVPERDPADWELQGWDGSAWVTLHSVTGQPMWEERFQTKTWDFVNDSLAFSTYRLHITAINGDAEGLMQIAELQLFGEIVGNNAVQYPPTSVKDKAPVVNNFRLEQNYPNPFNPTTTINFNLPNTMDVKLTIFDILGREVEILVDEKMSAGFHTVTFDGLQHASGVYFYHLKAGDRVFNRKMMLIK